MLLKELQTYLATLKQVARKGEYKEVELGRGEIRVRTKDQFLVLKADVKQEGVYELPALDLLALDLNADISAFRKSAEPLGVSEPEGVAIYDTALVDKTMLARLDQASKYVSKDEFRPALTRVHFMDGDIFATDGYRAILDKITHQTWFANFSPTTIASVKKCFKYGVWHVHFGKTEGMDSISNFSNGTLTIWDKGVNRDSVPKMREVISKGNAKKYNVCDTAIYFPYEAVKRVAEKGRTKVEIGLDGEIDLENVRLPLKARIAEDKEVYGENDSMKIVMPRADGKDDSLICFDLALLSAMKPNKEGILVLQMLKQGDGEKHLIHVL